MTRLMDSLRRARMPLLIVACGISSACVRPLAQVPESPVPPHVIQTATRFQKEYVFAPGDQLEIVVRRAPEVSRTVTIRSDGNISLPLIQDVQAAGRTPKELADDLTARFATRLVDPEVNVIATQIRQPVVYVTGDVTQAAVVPLRDAPTAIQALTAAGGIKRTGATREISLIRLNPDGFVQAIAIPVPVKGQPGPYMALRSTLLQADDVLFVPESGRSQIARVLDDFVNRPLTGVNSVLGLYLNFRLVNAITK
jgi:polysaccharide export outer membrane protein